MMITVNIPAIARPNPCIDPAAVAGKVCGTKRLGSFNPIAVALSELLVGKACHYPGIIKGPANSARSKGFAIIWDRPCTNISCAFLPTCHSLEQ